MNERVQWQLRERDSISPPEQRLTTDSAIKQTKQILTSTTKTTVAMLSSVSDGKWWRRTLASLHPARRSSFVSGPDWEDMNSSMEQQGCHPFYEEIIENAYSNKVNLLPVFLSLETKCLCAFSVVVYKSVTSIYIDHL